jgi:hypothetical protein
MRHCRSSLPLTSVHPSWHKLAQFGSLQSQGAPGSVLESNCRVITAVLSRFQLDAVVMKAWSSRSDCSMLDPQRAYRSIVRVQPIVLLEVATGRHSRCSEGNKKSGQRFEEQHRIQGCSKVLDVWGRIRLSGVSPCVLEGKCASNLATH